jgi:hypothetical protein
MKFSEYVVEVKKEQEFDPEYDCDCDVCGDDCKENPGDKYASKQVCLDSGCSCCAPNGKHA